MGTPEAPIPPGPVSDRVVATSWPPAGIVIVPVEDVIDISPVALALVLVPVLLSVTFPPAVITRLLVVLESDKPASDTAPAPLSVKPVPAALMNETSEDAVMLPASAPPAPVLITTLKLS